MKKAANEVDRHVGARIRSRRNQIGMSQEKLGSALGLTFQQVQKYEKGSNRVSASRLQHLSRILDVTIGYFYEGSPPGDAPLTASGFGEAPPPSYQSDAPTGDALKLVDAFRRIRDAKSRRLVLDLAVTLSRHTEPERSE